MQPMSLRVKPLCFQTLIPSLANINMLWCTCQKWCEILLKQLKILYCQVGQKSRFSTSFLLWPRGCACDRLVVKGPGFPQPCQTSPQYGGEGVLGQPSKYGNQNFPFNRCWGSRTLATNISGVFGWSRAFIAQKFYVLLTCLVPGPLGKMNRLLLRLFLSVSIDISYFNGIVIYFCFCSGKLLLTFPPFEIHKMHWSAYYLS